jgi:predicted TIM-barrel fold metal-dependent hydrolase
MSMPGDVRIVDLMLGIPDPGQSAHYDFLRPLLRDRQSLEEFEFPPQYMFKDFPRIPEQSDYIRYTLDLMDRFNVEWAQIGVAPDTEVGLRALREHPDRFFGGYGPDPNRGMEGVRELVQMHERHGIKAVHAFPAGTFPQVPIGDARWYPIYAKCVELDLPFQCCVGIPGPRIPGLAQHVEQLDQVCWFFPELRFVMRHGAEPWEELAVKLMLKWPNLYYSTTAFAPKHYPKAIIDFANTRGADKILYAGYFPSGLTLERIFSDLPHVPFRDHVWPKFLRENSLRVFKLGK